MPAPPYLAHASVSRSASSARIGRAFKIEVRFQGGLSDTHVKAFQQAADRWSRVIVGDLPSASVDGQVIDDVLIEAEGLAIDGPDKVLGESGPTVLRPKTAGAHAFLPIKGKMAFDLADLDAMHQEGTLGDVIAHEMGHSLGIGTIWARKRLLVAARSRNPTFRGRQARTAYGQLLGTSPQAVPVENLGGSGTRNSHWRESVFGNELMSGFVDATPNPLSLVTVASLGDLGYTIDLASAEPYALPTAAQPPASHLAATQVLQQIKRPIATLG